jgi:uncharacterized protein (DUF433 family)
MELESYFDFLDEYDIRVKGTRVGIEYIVQEYNEGAGPEEIALRFPTVSLEQIHATLTYYLANRTKIDEYARRVNEYQEAGWREQQEHPSEFILSLRQRIEKKRQELLADENSPLSKLRAFSK